MKTRPGLQQNSQTLVLIGNNCITTIEQFISYISDKNKFTNKPCRYTGGSRTAQNALLFIFLAFCVVVWVSEFCVSELSNLGCPLSSMVYYTPAPTERVYCFTSARLSVHPKIFFVAFIQQLLTAEI